MPSTFSVNKPSKSLEERKRQHKLQKKRDARAKVNSVSKLNHKPTEPKTAAYYQDIRDTSKGVITKTLSKKKAQKLERNARYIAKRNEQLNHDLAVQQEGMDIEMPSVKREKKQKPETHLDKVKKALWTAVEDSVASSATADTSGEGTTIGIQAF